MNFVPFDRMKTRIETSKEDSDIGYFYDLLLHGEFLTKVISLYLVTCINDDSDRSRYRFEYTLARANAIGEFSKVIDEIITGPSSQLLTSQIRDLELKELNQRSTNIDWQYKSQVLLHSCLNIFEIETNPLPVKSQLIRWFHAFTLLRNKTKGHGAPSTAECNKACPLLEESIMLIESNFSAFKRPWAHLHRNLNGKYRVSKITIENEEFSYLKSEKEHSYQNGIYVFLDYPRIVNLFYSTPELSDFYITNGNIRSDSFECISYVTDDRLSQSAVPYLHPITQLPQSHTNGQSELQILGNTFTNLPKSSDFYIPRKDLEDELTKVLSKEDTYPIITLLGRGGVGKTSLALNVINEITSTERFELIIWFSSRDVDLLLEGPKQVQNKILNIEDISKEYCILVKPDTPKKEFVEFFSHEMTKNSYGKALFVFDNFETVTNPVEVF